MVCPKCGLEAVITKNKRVFKTDEGKLFRIMTYSCRNKKCNDFEKEVGEVTDEISVEID